MHIGVMGKPENQFAYLPETVFDGVWFTLRGCTASFCSAYPNMRKQLLPETAFLFEALPTF